MVRAIVLTALVAAVASGLQLGNPAADSRMVRRAPKMAAKAADMPAAGGPKPDMDSPEDEDSPDAAGGPKPGQNSPDDGEGLDAAGPDPEQESVSGEELGDSEDTGARQVKAERTGGRQHKAERTGVRLPRPQATDAELSQPEATDLPQGAADDGLLAGAQDPDLTGGAGAVPAATGLAGNNSPVETDPSQLGFGADATGFPDGAAPPVQTGVPPGAAAPTIAPGAGSTEVPVLISEGQSRPVGRVTALLGLGAVALAIGLS